MSLASALLNEIEHEAKTTRRVLERVPADKLSWKPHHKSMSAGELALHIGQSPGRLANTMVAGGFDFGTYAGTPQPQTTSEILNAHDESLATIKTVLDQLGDDGLQRTWTATMNGTTLMSMPNAALVRMIMMNHIYHHRGQLSVYLRLLDVPVPSIYGPSADDNPFVAATA